MARYKVVPERSTIAAEATSSLHPIRAEAKGVEGWFESEVRGDTPDLATATSGRIEIEAESLKTGSRLHDPELEKRLEVGKYPRIRGEVKEARALDSPGRYHVRGELSLHGVTRPIEGDVTLELIDADTVEVSGEKVIDMREFNLNPPRVLMLKVHPEVVIRGRVVARKER